MTADTQSPSGGRGRRVKRAAGVLALAIAAIATAVPLVVDFTPSGGPSYGLALTVAGFFAAVYGVAFLVYYAATEIVVPARAADLSVAERVTARRALVLGATVLIVTVATLGVSGALSPTPAEVSPEVESVTENGSATTVTGHVSVAYDEVRLPGLSIAFYAESCEELARLEHGDTALADGDRLPFEVELTERPYTVTIEPRTVPSGVVLEGRYYGPSIREDDVPESHYAYQSYRISDPNRPFSDREGAPDCP